jgi:hypothetical protein
MKAEAVGGLQGSRFYPDPAFTHTLETSRLPGLGVCEQAAPADVS